MFKPFLITAADRNRTGTGITTHGILSPGRLPVPPLRQKISDRRTYPIKWTVVDSNHRSNLQQIYSLSPLATRESAHLSMCPDRGKLYHSLSRYASYKFKKCHLFSINARKTKGFPGVAVHSGNQSFLHIRIPYNIPSLITS